MGMASPPAAASPPGEPGRERPDLVVRGGLVVDGSGAAPFVGDVAVVGGVISEVGPHVAARGRQEIDARGLVVAPGWIDAHTHYDAQWSWDPYLSPSASCGVTTAVMGNCGIGYAPCQKDRREFLSTLVESVEDIPGRVIAEGLTYDFETFEEYLDSLGRASLACDVAVLVGHAAVRTWVMGRRANLADRPQGATGSPVLPHEIRAIASLVRDAVAAGAFGFSTSRLLIHRDPSGFLTPGSLAGSAELLAICDAIAEGGGGAFEMSNDFALYDDFGAYARADQARLQDYRLRELRWMTEVADRHGSRVAFTLNTSPGMEWILPHLDDLNARGGLAKGQCYPRAQGFLFAFGARMHPFVVSPAFADVAKRCPDEGFGLLAALADPGVRARVTAQAEDFFSREHPAGPAELAALFRPFHRIYRWTPGYEPETGRDDIKSLALQGGMRPLEAAYDVMLKGGVLWKPFAGYDSGDNEALRRLFQHRHVIPGFGDGGAHETVFQDACGASGFLTHWVRDRHRGPKLAIEHAVRLNTSDVAHVFGLEDRGLLAAGKRADINVIDLERLRVCEPYLVRDLPQGQQRWMQKVEGYVTTLVAGQATFVRGAATGALPGRLVRNPRRRAEAFRGVAAEVSGALEGGLRAPPCEGAGLRALDGAGRGGASAAARVLRGTVEEGPAAPGGARSKL